MKEIQQLRRIAVKLGVSGTAIPIAETRIYKGGYGFVGLQCFVPYTQNRSSDTSPLCTVFRTTIDKFGKRKQFNNDIYNMLYVGYVEMENAKYMVFECMLPKAFTDTVGELELVFTYSEVNAEDKAVSRLASGVYRTNVFDGDVSDGETVDPTGGELARLNDLTIKLDQLDGRTANVPNLVKDIQKVASNAFTFTNNSGLTSAPIVLDSGEAAPMPLGAASVVRVPSTGWTQSGDNYTVVIGAALHGQMRDGATADDLWVSFVSADGTDFDGVYQGFTVNEAGDITVTVTTPVAMTVRVWNGKGLVDVTAREEIAAETARAEAAEQTLQTNINAEQSRAEAAESDLQGQIDHIVDTGVDKLAREQIAAETARAEAAEAALQGEIDANKSSIQGLNNNIAEIEAVIPSATTPENQLADKAFVNSSINALAAFYIESTAAGGAFATKAALTGATTFYNGGQPRVPTTNDYAIVLSDESQQQNADGTYPTTRYSWQGGTYPTGQWGFQYIVNNTPLTQAQVDAINSGITKQKIASMDAATAAKYTKPTSGIPESDLSEAVQEKINTAAPVYSVNGKTGAVNLNAGDVGAMPISGGKFTGRVGFSSGAALPNEGVLPYFLGIQAFADGGNMIYRTASDVLGDLGGMPKSGGTFTGPIISKNDNDFMSRGNEFNFIGSNYSGNSQILVNYRGGTVTSYVFGNGAAGLADIRGKNVYDNNQRVYSPNNKQPIYLHRVSITVVGASTGNVFLWIYSSSPDPLNLTKFFNYLKTRNSTGTKTAYPARGYITGSPTMNVDGVYVSGTTPLGSAITLCNGQTNLRLNGSVTYGDIGDSVNDNTTI